ncbi:MAG TPA: VCBS repeat-containing protein, partial [Candidatus Dormibacteraeota bacterium]|nr:VCBS repeat-containing protein [Candidatus Dormibacteraeota bacterium]
NGDGTFRNPLNIAVRPSPSFVATTDVNGDGIADLVVSNQGPFGNPGSASILLGVGDGGFLAPQTFPSGGSPNAVATGDFNGDGFADLAVSNAGGYQSSGNVEEYLGNGDGTFQVARDLPLGTSVGQIVSGDFNGDGFLDLAMSTPNSNTATVLLGNGDGTFGPPKSFPTAGGSLLVVGDFNGDGRLDLAVAGFNNVSVLLGKGDGTFQPPKTTFFNFSINAMTSGDFNGDSKLDLIVGGFSFGPPTGNVAVLLGKGDGTFQTPLLFTGGKSVSGIGVGDLNGDSVPDLAVVDPQSDSVSIFLGNGDGTFRAGDNVPVGRNPSGVAIGDLNSDGILDIAVVNSDSNTVSVALGIGDGRFQSAFDFSVGQNPISVVIADFNGDGLPDLAVTNANDNDISVLVSSGSLGMSDLALVSLQRPANFGAGSNPRALAVGDFDGNGLPDLAVANFSSNAVSILLNNTPPLPAPVGGGL